MTVSAHSAITIRDLLATPHLELSVIAGGAGIDRPLTWTHVSELEDPAPWLDGGELLMTNGLGLPKAGDAQAQVIRSLDTRHAAGLGIGARGPALRSAMLEEAERRAFPVLDIPVRVPFLSIARMVADANQNSAHQRLLTHVRIFDALRPGRSASTIDSLFVRLEEISGYRLFLVSATGSPLATSLRRPPAEIVEVLLGSDFDASSGNPAVPGGYAVPVPLEQRDGTFLVALEQDGVPPAGLGAVRHMATVAALELSKSYYERETLRRRGGETLARLFAGLLPAAEAEAALADAGFDTGASLVVAAIRGAGRLPDEELYHRLCDLDVPSLVLADRDLFAILPAEPDVLAEVVRGLPVTAGVSGPRRSIGGWAVARKEAIWALERATRGPGEQLVRFPSSEAAMHWLPTDIRALEGLVHEILDPLLEYDAENNGAMFESLKVFFRHDRRLQNAAAELHVHKHTLSYRLSRIEQITGRDLSSMVDQMQLWLALQAYEIVAEGGGPDLAV